MENNEDVKRFVTADEVIGNAMTLCNSAGDEAYLDMMQFLKRGFNQLQFEALKRFVHAVLPVDMQTRSVKLPDDFVDWAYVGLTDNCGRRVPLTYDRDLVLNVAAAPSHCGCGCPCDELCVLPDTYKIENHAAVLPTLQRRCDYRILPYLNYQTCTYRWGRVPVPPACNYAYNLNVQTYNFPLTVNSQVIDGVVTPVNQTFNDWAQMAAALAASPSCQVTGFGQFIVGPSVPVLGAYNVTTLVGTVTHPPGTFDVVPVASCDSCRYAWNLPQSGYPLTIDGYYKNGVFVTVGYTASMYETLESELETLGFQTLAPGVFATPNGPSVYGDFVLSGTHYSPGQTCDFTDFPLTVESMVVNAHAVPVNQTFYYLADLNAYMATLGFSLGPNGYELAGGYMCYESINYSLGDGQLKTDTFAQLDCQPGNGLAYPHWIRKVRRDGVETAVNVEINSPSDQAAFFAGLGLTANGAEYVAVQSTAVWEWVLIEASCGVLTEVPFVPDNCGIDVHDVTYDNHAVVQLCENGDVLKEVHKAAFVTYPDRRDYSLSLPATVTDPGHFPDTLEYSINGNVQQALFSSLNDLATFLTDKGFVLLNGPAPYFYIVGTTDTYEYVTFLSLKETYAFNEELVYPTSGWVREAVETQRVCRLDVTPDCGCRRATPEAVAALRDCGCIDAGAAALLCCGAPLDGRPQRLPNAHGYFNIDIYEGIVKLNSTFPYDHLYVEYQSTADLSQGGASLVPAIALEALLWWCVWNWKVARKGTTAQERAEAKHEWLQAKRKLRMQTGPKPTLEHIMQILRLRG